MGLSKIGQKTAGKLLTPAVWVLDYGVNETTPDNVDVGLYALGLLGSIAAAASIVTSLGKSVVDDAVARDLKVVRNDEDPKYRKYIKSCYSFGVSGAFISAQVIAGRGGTAWQHRNGLWVYITDANGHLVLNFKPNVAVDMFAPNWPLKPTMHGGFRWGRV